MDARPTGDSKLAAGGRRAGVNGCVSDFVQLLVQGATLVPPQGHLGEAAATPPD